MEFNEVWALGVEVNMGRFWNELRNMYAEVFPWVEEEGCGEAVA